MLHSSQNSSNTMRRQPGFTRKGRLFFCPVAQPEQAFPGVLGPGVMRSLEGGYFIDRMSLCRGCHIKEVRPT